MTTTAYVLIFISHAVWFWLGYKTGKTKERKDWNKLIQDGTIPPPCPPAMSSLDEVDKE